MSTNQPQRRINHAGLEIIKASESFSATRYLCPAGKPTIGWGHVIRPSEGIQEPISQAQGLALLIKDVEEAAAAVERLVKVPLTDNQFSALVSFTFNVGSDEDADAVAEGLGDSTLLRLLNAGDYQGAADEFPKWRKGGGRVLPGLVTRRARERELFLTPDPQPISPAEEDPAEAKAPFRAEETKEDPMPNWLVAMAMPMAIKLGTNLLPSVIGALLPESAKGMGQHFSEETKAFFMKMVESFQAYADSTPNDTLLGQADNVAATILRTLAEGFGLLPSDSGAPQIADPLPQG